jgi:transposase
MVPPVAVSELAGSVAARAEEILAFERAWWQYAGAKEDAIEERFGVSVSAYYQLLNALLDDESLAALDPMLVKRLKRQRAQRQRDRAASRAAGDR